MFGKAFVVAAALALVASSAEAAVLYSQPSNNFGFFFSQNDAGGLGNFATTYDNFTLASSATIQSVDFTGGYLPSPGPGAITGFTISIFQDSSNSPGTLLYTAAIPGTGHETFVGTDALSDLVYSYSENISFAASAGTQYWLSIVPDLTLPYRWGWENSNVGDGVGYQQIFGTLGRITSDSAFTLNDTPVPASVPEPFTLGVFGVGLLSMGTLRYGRKAKA
jgi:hypothetical protein